MCPASKIVILSLLFLLASSPLACQLTSETFEVIWVIDGDTIVIEGGYHVRYIGIDAPEKGEFYYLEAKEANSEIVEGKKVRLEKDVSDKDHYGRLLRYVYVGDTFVGAEIVSQGYACAKAYSPDIKYQVYLEAVEKEARQGKRGIWEQE